MQHLTGKYSSNTRAFSRSSYALEPLHCHIPTGIVTTEHRRQKQETIVTFSFRDIYRSACRTFSPNKVSPLLAHIAPPSSSLTSSSLAMLEGGCQAQNFDKKLHAGAGRGNECTQDPATTGDCTRRCEIQLEYNRMVRSSLLEVFSVPSTIRSVRLIWLCLEQNPDMQTFCS